MDNYVTRYLYDTDVGTRLSSALQSAVQMYYSAINDPTWGNFTIISVACVIAFVAGVLVTASARPISQGLAWLGKRFRAIKGRHDMRKRHEAQEMRWIADRFTDVVEEGVAAGQVSRRAAQYYYGGIGRMFKIKDLIPGVSAKKRMLALKSKLKKKHGSKVIELAAKRKEREPQVLRLKDRLALASKIA